MGFANEVTTNAPGLDAGIEIGSKPHNIEAYSTFESGVVTIGRFAKYDTGSIDALDGSATPKIAGVVRNKLNRAMGETTYTTAKDSVIEVVDFGHVTVEVTAAATPSKFDPVYVVNATGVDSGKATQDSTGNLLVSNAVFWEQIKTGVWVVRLQNYR